MNGQNSWVILAILITIGLQPFVTPTIMPSNNIFPFDGNAPHNSAKFGRHLSGIPRSLDRNGNRVADYLEEKLYVEKALGEKIRLFIFPREGLEAKMRSILHRLNYVDVLKYYDFLGAYLISIKMNEMEKLVSDLAGSFSWIEEDQMGVICGSGYSYPFRAEEVFFQVGYDGIDDVTVAIIDSGIDGSRPDFSDKIVYYRDLTGESVDPVDNIGHGTMIASIIAGEYVEKKTISLVHFGEASTTYKKVMTFKLTKQQHVNITLEWESEVENRVFLKLVNDEGSEQLVANTTNKSIHIKVLGQEGLNSILLSCRYREIRYVISVDYELEYAISIRGVAPKVKLAIWKVSRGLSMSTNSSMVIDALGEILKLYKELNITVVNLSISFTKQIIALDEAINRLVTSGVIVVTPAGNEYIEKRTQQTNQICSPGTAYLAITVTAVNEYYGVALYSSRGGTYTEDSMEYIKPDIAMFGGGMLYGEWPIGADSDISDYTFEDIKRGDYLTSYGTSFSTAYISGLVALLSSLLMEEGRWEWDINQAMRLKSIILLSTFETTYIGRHELDIENSTLRTTPEFSNGTKDYDEGFGVVVPSTCLDLLSSESITGDTELEEIISIKTPVIAKSMYSHDLIRVTFSSNSSGAAILCIYSGTDFDGSPNLYWFTLSNASKILLCPGEIVLVIKLVRNETVLVNLIIDIVAKRWSLMAITIGIGVVILAVIVYTIAKIVRIVRGKILKKREGE